MTYISKKEVEEARWIGLAEATIDIHTIDNVAPEEAVKRLILAIEEEALHARLDGYKLRPDSFQGRVLICLESPGWMYIDYESVGRPRSLEIVQGPVNNNEDPDEIDFRAVTILRDDFNKYWSLDEREASDSKVAVRKRPEGLAKNYSDSAAEKAAREMYDGAEALGLAPPNKPRALTQMSKKGFPRSVAEPVLERPEFAQRRRKPGNQKK